MFTPDFIEVRMAQSLGFRVFDLLLMLFCELFALSGTSIKSGVNIDAPKL
jgi:hypothetical protein